MSKDLTRDEMIVLIKIQSRYELSEEKGDGSGYKTNSIKNEKMLDRFLDDGLVEVDVCCGCLMTTDKCNTLIRKATSLFLK